MKIKKEVVLSIFFVVLSIGLTTLYVANTNNTE